MTLAFLAVGRGSASGEAASHAARLDQRARLIEAWRNPSLSREERRALRTAIQEALDRMPDAGIAGGPGAIAAKAGSAADGTWRRIPAPAPRAFHTAIYDPMRERMVVFGGFDWWQHARYEDTYALTLDETPTWMPLPTAPFGSRHGHTAIHDPVQDQMVVFGGYGDAAQVNDTWALSLGGTTGWTQIVPEGTPPSGRAGHTAIYDPVRDRMVLFGGYGNGVHGNDVWALSLRNTPTWTQIVPGGTPPSARRWHTAIYDPVQDRMLVFGGSGVDHSPTNDVWALSLADTPTWSQLVSEGVPPSPRDRHTAVYDSVRNQMVILGTYNNDVWALSLGLTPEWLELISTGRGRDWATAIYDPVRDGMVEFGGEDTGFSIPVDDVHVLSLQAPQSWATLEPVGRPPDGLLDAPTVYDPLRDRLVVGTDRWWTLSLSEPPLWRELPAQGTLPGNVAGTAIYDALRDRLVGFGGSRWNGSPMNDVWALSLGDTPTWIRITPEGTRPSEREAHTMIYDETRDRAIVFGGVGSYYDPPLNDVWSLSLGDNPTWSQIMPEGTPPSGYADHTSFYDPVRDQMVVYGGYGNEVWVLSLGDTSTWAQITPQGSPPSSWTRHAAIYDPVRNRIVVLGGEGDSPGQAWALSLGDSPTWSELAPAGPLPQPRCLHSTLYDPARDRMLIVGGRGYCSTPEPLSDVWALTWGTPLLAPPNVTAEAGPASITLRWTASPSNNVTAYRISYGTLHETLRYSGNQAAEGPSGIEVAAGQLSFALTCLPDSVFRLAVRAVAAGGGGSGSSQEIVAQPQVIGGTLAVHPHTPSMWLSGVLEPGSGFAADQVLVESLRLNDALAPERVTLGDENANGVADLTLRFAREEVLGLFPQGQNAEVKIGGRLFGCHDVLSFSVRDTIRLIQPSVFHPVAGLQLAAGAAVEIAWSVPNELAVDSVVVLVSVDNRRTWGVAGSGPGGFSVCEWTPTAIGAESCYVAVVAYEYGEAVGVGYGGPFQVSTPTAEVFAPERFGLHSVRPNPSKTRVRITFGLALARAVTLQVFDLRGRLVETLVDGPTSAGQHEATWDVRGVAAGVFFVQLRSGAIHETRRLVVVR